MTMNRRIRADFQQAASLLRDKNLVWSSDLDSIRLQLADYLDYRAQDAGENSPHLVAVVQRLIADEYDISI